MDNLCKMIKLTSAAAHCDIPCKIYDPSIFLVAGLSVARLIDLIKEEQGKDTSISQTQLIRLVMEKEVQAKIVKDTVNTIWGDYFKEPQLKKFPQIHVLVHVIMQSASKCKQESTTQNANVLIDHLNQFAEIFWASKEIKTERVKAPYPPALEVVSPVLSSD